VLLISPSFRQSSELFRKVTDLLSRLGVHLKVTEDNKLSIAFKAGLPLVSSPSREATIRGLSGASLIVALEISMFRRRKRGEISHRWNPYEKR
jgi:hypothetical protein